MNSDPTATTKRLVNELEKLRARNAELEQAEADRQLAEKERKESESRYRTLIENSLTGICVQQDGRLVYLNERFADIFGYDAETLVGRRIWDLMAPEHREMVRLRGIDRLAGKEPVRQYEVDGLTANGERRNLAVWFSLIELRGKPGIVGTVVDVTGLKMAEAALKESEERFRKLFETAPDCMFIKDTSLRYTHVNPAMVELFQATGSGLIGSTDQELFGARAAAYLRELERRALSGESVEAEHTRSIGGASYTFQDVRVPIRDSEGRISGLYGMARNITDHKTSLVQAPTGERDECVSGVMRSTFATARLAAEKDGIVLLLGESGVGKDYLARYIHDNSPRRDGPYFALNCAALPPELAESELFGHETGAFTGAVRRRRGLLELAEGGTLLLNEIGELSPHLQAKLLTFLDTRTFTRVGGEATVPVSARIIAATNRDLEDEVAKGRFRTDLYYRINVLAIRTPPLRERKEDIPGLVDRLLRRLAQEIQASNVPSIDPTTLNSLTQYSWPGNVRELRNVLERGLMLWRGGPLELQVGGPIELGDDTLMSVRFPVGQTLSEVTDELTRVLCEEALRRSGGSRVGAARLLGVSRNSVYRIMKRLGIVTGSGADL